MTINHEIFGCPSVRQSQTADCKYMQRWSRTGYQANFWGEKTRHYVVTHLFQLIKLKHRAGPAESKEFSKASAWQLQILQTTAAVMDWGIHSLVLRVADLEKQGGREEMSLVWCLDRTWRDATGPGAFGCIWGVGDSRLSNVYIAHSHTQSLKFQKELNMKAENPRIGEVTIPETDWVKSCVLTFFWYRKFLETSVQTMSTSGPLDLPTDDVFWWRSQQWWPVEHCPIGVQLEIWVPNQPHIWT